MFCKKCGAELAHEAAFCSACGTKAAATVQERPKATGFNVEKPSAKNVIPVKKIEPFCPKCGSTDIDIQLHQEMRGSKTTIKTKSKYRQKRHGFLWWCFIGWWWWMVDLCLWIYLFPIRFLIQLFKKKDYTGTSKSTEKTKNKIAYRTVYLCKNCGRHWEDQR